jgi:hypothetical protein
MKTVLWFRDPFIPEGGPDDAEGSDDLVGIDFFALTVRGSFFGGLSLAVLSFRMSRVSTRVTAFALF